MDMSEDVRVARADKALDQRARRAAKRAGLAAVRSRGRSGTIENWYGQFMLVDPSVNMIVAGEKFTMTAQEVIDYCAA